MKFVVLGATGPTGQRLIEEALERGHEIVALVRNPDKLQIKNDKLKVHKVDIFNADELSPHMEGADAVMSCLGCRPSFFNWTPITFYLDTAKPIVAAMRKAKVTRGVFVTSMCTVSEPGNPWIVEWILKPLVLGNVVRSMGDMERYLAECEDINFTCVRPPGLTNDGASGKELKAVEAQWVDKALHKIPRRDVAKFMLSCVGSEQWNRKCVAIGIPE